MELRDGDFLLRPWTLDDVPAIVDGVQRRRDSTLDPVIPRPYTEGDARAFVQGEVPGVGTHQFAITARGTCRRLDRNEGQRFPYGSHRLLVRS